MTRTLAMVTALASLQQADAATDPWDLPPIRYSETTATDSIAQLAAELKSADASLPTAPLDRLQAVLEHLDIPASSQVLVFSKTSKQNHLISPTNPRALFFNDHAYVGYVPGGDIEVISHDPVLGPVFYMIEASYADTTAPVVRQKSSCFSCHGTARTKEVPGMLVRSVFPDATGQPLLTLGSHLTTHSSPIPDRWGGYYVTGTSSLPHLGNRTFTEAHDPTVTSAPPAHNTLQQVIDTSRYPRPTSDIVALMVLEHQCHMQNLLTAADMNFRRFLWLRQSLHPDATATDTASRNHIEQVASDIVAALLFNEEAPLGHDGISGDRTFQDAFSRRYPRTVDGRSLADFHLQKRLFKYPCSYMVYSPAFASLPEVLRFAVLQHLYQDLKAAPTPDNHPHIPSSTRRKILDVLTETLPDFPPDRKN